MRNGIIAVVLGLASSIGNGQEGQFLASRENTFQQACGQWMCKELVAVYPETFKAIEPENTFDPRFPVAHVHQGMEIPIELRPSDLDDFRELYFPHHSGSRFLILKSLCDFYFPLFERKISNHQLPDGLKYLPLVLSGMNAHFTDEMPASRSGGDRAGLWSLDFLVARSLHLRVDSLVDERRGGDITTEKALDYIQTLYLKYDGNQTKVLLAYFKSVPFLEKHLAEHGEVNFDALDHASREFLRFFVYTVELFEMNETENHLVHYFDIMGNYENIFFERSVPLLAMKEVLGADVQQIQSTNPVYCGNRIDSSYRRVAFILDKRFSSKYHLLKDSLYAWKPAPSLTVSPTAFEEEKIYYKVKKGDSLGKIAQKYKVSISQLKKWNNLKRDRIYAGQKLVIIKKQKTQTDGTLDESTPPKTQNEVTTTKAIEKVNATAKSTSPAVIKYKVRSGDSMWKIANKYPGVTADDIMKWNKCSENIRPGQILLIYPKK